MKNNSKPTSKPARKSSSAPASKPRRVFRFAYWTLLLVLPASTFFSYYPIISLGGNSTMNFELSLPLIFLAIFDLIAFINLILVKTRPEKNTLASISDRRFFLFSLFPLYATISIFWSANPLRGLLTAGIVWLLFFAVFAILYISPLLTPPARIRRYFLITFFATAAFVCLFCFLQSILDISGFSRELTLLCPGCTYRSFGFPHPSGFAIEPQFMGNLLLAPTLLVLYLLLRPEKSTHKKIRAMICIFALLFSTTLFFTLSRGAIYAYAIALIILFIFALVRKFFRPSLVIIPVASFLLALCLQGTFAQLGPTSETFTSAVAKSVHQLSLGLVDFCEKSSNPAETSDQTSEFASPSLEEALEDPSNLEPYSYEALPESSLESPLVASSGELDAPEDVYFDGYVAESTNVRLNLNGAAIDTWLSAPGHPESDLWVALNCHKFCCPCVASGRLTPTSVLFGVGLGGAGTALYLNSFITGINSPKEIVQNESLSLLLELGLVGIALIVFSLLIAFVPQLFSAKFLDGRAANTSPETSAATSVVSSRTAQTAKNPSRRQKAAKPLLYRSPILPLLLSLIIAYVITLQFFSGLPNALHIYLLPPLLYYLFADQRAPS